MKKHSIIIADDHTVIREAIVSMIHTKCPTIEVVAEAENGKDLLDKINRHGLPDVILMDVDMPVMDGFETMSQIDKKYGQKAKVLVLSIHQEYYVVSKFLKLGASGYITKRVNSNELEQAITHVRKNGFYLSPEISRLMMRDHINPQPKGFEISHIEEEILRLVCEQKNTTEIAKELKLSKHTVNTYRARLLEKTDSINIIGLVVFAMKTGLFRTD